MSASRRAEATARAAVASAFAETVAAREAIQAAGAEQAASLDAANGGGARFESADVKLIADLQRLDEHHRQLAREFIRMLVRMNHQKAEAK